MNSAIVDRLNNAAYEAIATSGIMQNTAALKNEQIVDVITGCLYGVKQLFIDTNNAVGLKYPMFQMAAPSYGRLVEFVGANMARGDDPVSRADGTIVYDYVRKKADTKAMVSTSIAEIRYPLTIENRQIEKLCKAGDIEGFAKIVAIMTASLYDGIANDHNAIVPGLIGRWLNDFGAANAVTIPALDGTTGDARKTVIKQIVSAINTAKRNLTMWKSKKYNPMGVDHISSESDLVLVCNLGPDGGYIDDINAELGLSPIAPWESLTVATGLDIYYLPHFLLSSSVARLNGLANFPGMQTADMTNATFTDANADVKFLVAERGFVNAALEYMDVRNGMSIAGNFNQTYAHLSYALWYGAYFGAIALKEALGT
jgi:hypothetical protein